MISSQKDRTDGIFSDVYEAIKEAQNAQQILKNLSFAKREQLIANMRKRCMENLEQFAYETFAETKLGDLEAKREKFRVIIEKTPGTEDIKGETISTGSGQTIIEKIPYGIIGSIIPGTSPGETIINNSIGMLAGGNTIIFSLPRKAEKLGKLVIQTLNRAIIEAGGPANCLVTVDKMSKPVRGVIMSDPAIKLLVVTGGHSLTKAALISGKKAICAGAGNPPVIVDETANIAEASLSIIRGASFDNNLNCIGEKEIIAVGEIYGELLFNLQKNDAYLLNHKELEKLEQLVLAGNELGAEKCYRPDASFTHQVRKSLIGQSADKILERIGINEPSAKIVLAETDRFHPFAVNELAMPVIPIIKVKDIDEAVETAVFLENGNKHTAVIHSNHLNHIQHFMREVDTAIFVVNQPSYAGIGIQSEGYATCTIASGTGEGLTSAKTFMREKRAVIY